MYIVYIPNLQVYLEEQNIYEPREETMKLFASKNIFTNRLKCSQNYCNYIDRRNNKTEGFNNKLKTTLE